MDVIQSIINVLYDPQAALEPSEFIELIHERTNLNIADATNAKALPILNELKMDHIWNSSGLIIYSPSVLINRKRVYCLFKINILEFSYIIIIRIIYIMLNNK